MSIKQGINNIDFIQFEGIFITKVYVWENSVQKTIYSRTPPIFYRSKIPYVTLPSGASVTFSGGSADYFAKKIYDINISCSRTTSGNVVVYTGDAEVLIATSKEVNANYQNIPYTTTGFAPQYTNFSVSGVNEATRNIAQINVYMERYSGMDGATGTMKVGNKTQSYTWSQPNPAQQIYTTNVTFNDVTFTQAEWDTFYKVLYKGSRVVSQITYAPSDFNQFYY